MGDEWDLDEASEFLLIAATLLDLKAARLLPAGRGRGRGGPRPAGGAGPALRPAAAVQGVQGGGGAHRRAGGGRRPALPPRGHPGAPVRRGAARPGARHRPGAAAQAGGQGDDARSRCPRSPSPTSTWSGSASGSTRRSSRERLRRAGTATFALLCADCETTLEVVARFLALLELYREGLVAFVQEQALERADRTLDRPRRRRRRPATSTSTPAHRPAESAGDRRGAAGAPAGPGCAPSPAARRRRRRDRRRANEPGRRRRRRRRMSSDERRDSLADQAAAWVPPWRTPATAAASSDAGRPPQTDDREPPDPAGRPAIASRDLDAEPVREPSRAGRRRRRSSPATAATRSRTRRRRSPTGRRASSRRRSRRLDRGRGRRGLAGSGRRGGRPASRGGVRAGAGGGPSGCEPGRRGAGTGGRAYPRAAAGGAAAGPVAPSRRLSSTTRSCAGALEAILLVVDEPVSELVLAQVLEQPPERVGPVLRRDRRGLHRRRARLRAAPGRRRLAALHPAGIRHLRGAVRPGRAVRAADPGRAGDTGRGRLQAAGDPVADLGHPGCQLRRGDPYPGLPRPGRGVRHRTGQRGVPLPDHHAVPGEARARTASTSCPRWPRSCPTTWKSLPMPRDDRTPRPDAPPTRGPSACRRCWPPPASAPGAPAKT